MRHTKPKIDRAAYVRILNAILAGAQIGKSAAITLERGTDPAIVGNAIARRIREALRK